MTVPIQNISIATIAEHYEKWVVTAALDNLCGQRGTSNRAFLGILPPVVIPFLGQSKDYK